jgi:hypothetical protein
MVHLNGHALLVLCQEESVNNAVKDGITILIQKLKNKNGQNMMN